jgi:hypothetical protein
MGAPITEQDHHGRLCSQCSTNWQAPRLPICEECAAQNQKATRSLEFDGGKAFRPDVFAFVTTNLDISSRGMACPHMRQAVTDYFLAIHHATRYNDQDTRVLITTEAQRVFENECRHIATTKHREGTHEGDDRGYRAADHNSWKEWQMPHHHERDPPCHQKQQYTADQPRNQLWSRSGKAPLASESGDEDPDEDTAPPAHTTPVTAAAPNPEDGPQPTWVPGNSFTESDIRRLAYEFLLLQDQQARGLLPLINFMATNTPHSHGMTSWAVPSPANTQPLVYLVGNQANGGPTGSVPNPQTRPVTPAPPVHEPPQATPPPSPPPMTLACGQRSPTTSETSLALPSTQGDIFFGTACDYAASAITPLAQAKHTYG